MHSNMYLFTYIRLPATINPYKLFRYIEVNIKKYVLLKQFMIHFFICYQLNKIYVQMIY